MYHQRYWKNSFRPYLFPTARLQQTPPANFSRHELHHRDNHHCQESDRSHHHDGDTQGSCDQDGRNSTTHYRMQSEQTRQVHSTRFYEKNYQSAFHQLLPKLRVYISLLHHEAETQHCLEALKNLLQQSEFKVPLSWALHTDVEPTIPKSVTAATTMMLLLTTASTLVLPTTVTPTTVLTTLTAAISSTTPTELRLVIDTRPILEAVPLAGTDLPFEPQLPSETITLPNCVHFGTTDSPHSIMLTMPNYTPYIDPNVEFFSLRTLHEIVLINFFSHIGVRLTMAVHVRATNLFLAIYQYFPEN
uniref:Uncharacterized protein n=1 Tax=Romanomermis culicivorax TaxID=13658 RepID=A0A915JFU9_ROMCU